jgi:hypothetical protein
MFAFHPCNSQGRNSPCTWGKRMAWGFSARQKYSPRRALFVIAHQGYQTASRRVNEFLV